MENEIDDEQLKMSLQFTVEGQTEQEYLESKLEAVGT